MALHSGSRTHAPPIGDDSWLGWFLSRPGHEFLCRVPLDYMQDQFNLIGLNESVTNYTDALGDILDKKYWRRKWVGEGSNMESEWLYGLIHARYILTPHGIKAMRMKFERGAFGLCPRVYCHGQHVLPIGSSTIYDESLVNIYCPRCKDIFEPAPENAALDGCMFGPSFPHMFFMHWPELRPQPSQEKYVPRLYGFQLHESALQPKPAEAES
ncbi:suppressor-of-stellate-like protein [Drosophila guanche]|uniref:Blast:Suppressor-of-stellate-like protein n=1 Tax=Drosophila guanche TaxID=7266 RepID=A0A3B0JIV0_DROGU|nr:suppressor-of-stellate-like protein [Drosophila guanche]SPP73359.1 blast:Suppressor-of-stellate-like protein [Drosophila guanche]